MSRTSRRHQTQGGPCEELAQVLDPAVDVAADVIGVVLLERRWCHDVAGQDAVAKAGSKTLDLGLDAGCHVVRRPMGHVAVGPGGVSTGRSARWIEQTLLGDDHIRRFSVRPRARRLLGSGDFGEGTPQVHRGSALARRSPPGNRAVEGPIDLEDRRPVAIPFELAPVARWQAMAGQAQYLPGSDVEQDGAGWG